MKSIHCFLRTTCLAFAVSGLVLAALSPAVAAPLMTLEGDAAGTLYDEDAGVRMTILNWAGEEQTNAVVAAYENYRDDMDAEAFLEALAGQDTLGYFFTQAATGYTIKYAWTDDRSDERKMVVLVTPALKTRNPYIWESRNESDHPFSVIELHWDGDSAQARVSLEADLLIGEQGNLELADFSGAELFARLADSTPYYLK